VRRLGHFGLTIGSESPRTVGGFDRRYIPNHSLFVLDRLEVESSVGTLPCK
jgi:hypothetical protein